jgi:small subunit ribosomal protein S21
LALSERVFKPPGHPRFSLQKRMKFRIFYPKGGESSLAHIVVDENEMLEKAIKRFKRMVEKEGIIREYKKREYYEKPSTILNRKKKAIARKLMKKSRKGRTEY